MRGRLASGILKQMGMADVVANSVDEYIQSAVTLARDAAARQAYRDRISTHRPALYKDTAAIRAIEEFLVVSCRPPNAGIGQTTSDAHHSDTPT